ncbi:MAG: bifunctional diaminohydroxyphosphoribosylaminopyrimidine deaminase/5-amino-6-(5-phosphoribosylamino)uracil reductase RibD [Prevotellaceae bacterium]|jgi:diaminohydroxyphosphoribosylaminopyrimidine deaminase/5-amino-6-(5-phosphoribosylamino)uracil reductase|nr:bifunctional diaminohydroxyphosphoribosylaminopyrimidine deaminase/5-amino-6-(5-phosphoribosylamino)uracil reductase RibD [Prevotellaceae bacterium]
MEDEKYMRRALQLARNGEAHTAPNPMVGAVIVCDDHILGEGYHIRCGQAHAEVNAVRSVQKRSLLRHATIYVTLEPCAHYGKTPPCADLLIAEGIPRMVIGCRDPFAKVDGLGIRKLREAGCEVEVGVLEHECRYLIRRFLTFHTRQRPYITLKWAESADGFIDRKRTGGTPTLLSNPLTSMLVHRLRASHDAILVGTRTALLDNPSLTVRNWYGHAPLRVVIDRHHVLPSTLQLFNDEAPTLCFDGDTLEQLLQQLHRQNIQSLLVEGGSTLLQAFIDAQLWDEAVVETAPIALVEGVSSPVLTSFYTVQSHFGHRFRHYTNPTPAL